MSVRILKPGLCTTVQDLGRWGYAHLGFSASGAFDRRAYRLGCILMGEQPGAPALEFLEQGPELEFSRTTLFCLTGAVFDSRLDGRKVRPWRVTEARAGSVLSIGHCLQGRAGYLHAAGAGFAATLQMGSASTSVRFKLGGIEGRPVRTGDILPLGKGPINARAGAFLANAESYYGFFDEPLLIRMVPGAQIGRFSPQALQAFFNCSYAVEAKSDRMGVRLRGKAVLPEGGADIVSEGIPLGSIQVNGAGQPMVMLADHQTVGGYAKLGVVARVDLPRLVQARPGRHIRFVPTSVEGAQHLLASERRAEEALLAHVLQAR